MIRNVKQLIINGKKSFDDFGLYIRSRNISSPKKKSIKQSVPFSNITYDFSNLNGEIYWEERTLKYDFDIAELTTEEMETVKSKILTWLLNVHDTDIYDPYIGNYHFRGSYNSDSWTEDFGAGTLSVSFTVYPYKISNKKTVITHTLIDGANEIFIMNNGSHRVTPTFNCSKSMTIGIGTSSYVFSSGETTSDLIKFDVGKNTLVVTPTGKDDTITIGFVEEVF